MKEILVIGGAGYIGSHMCKYLHSNDFQPIVLDNLSLGHIEAVKWGPLYQGNMDDTILLDTIFSRHNIEAVMHFAAFCYVGESVEKPLKYYHNNINATISLLSHMQRWDIKKFIFSSSCATYGSPHSLPITENLPQQPINPYGRTKYMMEQIIDDIETSTDLKSVCLRYFNAAGADPDGEIGEDHTPETHLIPIVIETALGKRKELTLFGDKYPTKDGTCIRDYIHINDLAHAHYLSLLHLLQGGSSKKYNLGNNQGYSNLDVIKCVQEVTGKKVPYTIANNRPGDPAALVGSYALINKELGWEPEFTTLSTIISSAFKWHSTSPNGFAHHC